MHTFWKIVCMQKISMFTLQVGVVSHNNTVISPGDLAAGQAALVFTSTGVAFATFICILTYHTYLCLKSRELHLYFRRRQIKGGDGRERKAVVGSVESAVDVPPKHTPTVTDKTENPCWLMINTVKCTFCLCKAFNFRLPKKCEEVHDSLGEFIKQQLMREHFLETWVEQQRSATCRNLRRVLDRYSW